ncbi:hypothetical protein BGZ91_012349 [Linnemannia elongata]|nr:hypothetical protein BGZ91_012349 [Linnemannia elongata]
MPPFSFFSRIKKKAPPERQNNDNPLPQAFRLVHKNQPCATTTISGAADEEELEPRRIVAAPDVVLEVVIGGEVTAASASTAGVDLSPLEKKVQDNLLSTPQQDPNRARRNPVYGDVMEAMQNYNHIDWPPQVSYLRGPQTILSDLLDVSDSSTVKKPVQRPAMPTAILRGPQIVKHFTAEHSSSLTKEQRRSTNKREHKPMNNSSAPVPTPSKHRHKGTDQPAQEFRRDRSTPITTLKESPTTGREGRGKTDEPVKDQPTTTGKSRQSIFTDAFFTFKWGKVDKPADDQSMTTIKPHLFSSDTTVSKTVKSELAQKRAGADYGDIATRVSLKDLDKQQHLILKSSHKNSLTQYTEATNNGDSYAQYRLGMLFELGDRCSAQQGFSTAQYVVGDRYEKGRDVVQDVSKAIEWYTKAAEQGYITAQLRLDWLYANGKGVPKNDAEALGDRREQTLVAEACEHGRGTTKNDRKALQWYIDIAETGGGDGQRKVAEFYRDGRCGSGNPQWDRLAKKWYDMVSEQDKGFKAQQETIGARKEQLSYTPPAPSYANNYSSKYGYEFSSNDPYYPSQPTQSSYTYGSQYAYPPPVQPMYSNGSQHTNPYALESAQRIWPHQLDPFAPQS